MKMVTPTCLLAPVSVVSVGCPSHLLLLADPSPRTHPTTVTIPPCPCCSYFTMQTLVKRAKHGDDGMDIDRAMMSNIAKRARFKESDIDPDAEYDYDAGVDL